VRQANACRRQCAQPEPGPSTAVYGHLWCRTLSRTVRDCCTR
jgi:hypothetical protein